MFERSILYSQVIPLCQVMLLLGQLLNKHKHLIHQEWGDLNPDIEWWCETCRLYVLGNDKAAIEVSLKIHRFTQALSSKDTSDISYINSCLLDVCSENGLHYQIYFQRTTQALESVQTTPIQFSCEYKMHLDDNQGSIKLKTGSFSRLEKAH